MAPFFFIIIAIKVKTVFFVVKFTDQNIDSFVGVKIRVGKL